MSYIGPPLTLHNQPNDLKKSVIAYAPYPAYILPATPPPPNSEDWLFIISETNAVNFLSSQNVVCWATGMQRITKGYVLRNASLGG